MAQRRRSSFTRLAVVLVAGLLVCGTGQSAWAQTATPQGTAPTPSRGWSIEIYGGAVIGSGTPTGSPVGSLPQGEVFTTPSGLPSRAVSSWYFGDGAILFGQVANEFRNRFGEQVSGLMALDPVLRSTSTEVTSGASFGVRVTRALSARLGLEIAVERSNRPLKLTAAGRETLDAARASFDSGFRDLITRLPQSNLIITSTADVTEPPAGSTVLTAALVLSLARRGPLGVHVLAGGGGSFGGSGALDLRLRGNYQFQVFGVFPISETDLVNVRIADESGTAIGVFGGGVTWALSPRAAVRADLRFLAGTSGVRTTVSATPSRSTVVPPIFISSLTTPSLQFSNSAGVRSSLSGSPIMELETFKSSGVAVRSQVTVGFVLRF